jgi:hypothetical protein
VTVRPTFCLPDQAQIGVVVVPSTLGCANAQKLQPLRRWEGREMKQSYAELEKEGAEVLAVNLGDAASATGVVRYGLTEKVSIRMRGVGGPRLW